MKKNPVQWETTCNFREIWKPTNLIKKKKKVRERVFTKIKNKF